MQRQRRAPGQVVAGHHVEVVERRAAAVAQQHHQAQHPAAGDQRQHQQRAVLEQRGQVTVAEMAGDLAGQIRVDNRHRVRLPGPQRLHGRRGRRVVADLVERGEVVPPARLVHVTDRHPVQQRRVAGRVVRQSLPDEDVLQDLDADVVGEPGHGHLGQIARGARQIELAADTGAGLVQERQPLLELPVLHAVRVRHRMVVAVGERRAGRAITGMHARHPRHAGPVRAEREPHRGGQVDRRVSVANDLRGDPGARVRPHARQELADAAGQATPGLLRHAGRQRLDPQHPDGTADRPGVRARYGGHQVADGQAGALLAQPAGVGGHDEPAGGARPVQRVHPADQLAGPAAAHRHERDRATPGVRERSRRGLE